MKYHLTLIRMAIIKKSTNNTRTREGVEESNHSTALVGLIEYRKIYEDLKSRNPDFSCKNTNDRDLIIKLDHMEK